MNSIKQLKAEEIINMLVDTKSFVEIGGNIMSRNTDFNMKDKKEPSDGVITGYGIIEGKAVYIYAQDISVLGGSIGEMHAKKIVNIYNMAIKNGAPIIGILNSTGLRLQEASDGINGIGEVYNIQAKASGFIPQIGFVAGSCGGGMEISAMMNDFLFMDSDAELFLNAPNTVSGNHKSIMDTSSSDFHAEHSGYVHVVSKGSEIFDMLRTLISIIPSNNKTRDNEDNCNDDLNRSCEGINNFQSDSKVILKNISDNKFILELKAGYGKDLTTSFIKMNGRTIGCIGNRSEIYDDEMNKIESFEDGITSEGCEKASDFIRFCDSFNIPILTIANSKGFSTTINDEKSTAKKAARLIYDMSNATVPKITLITGKVIGNVINVMNGKALGSDLSFCWPESKFAIMDAENAVRIIYHKEIKENESPMEFIRDKKIEYNNIYTNSEVIARRGYVDNIINPVDTRKHIIGGFEILYTKNENRLNKKHGTI